MEHYKLYIETGNTARNYRRITDLLGLQPEKPVDGADDPHNLWTYYAGNNTGDQSRDMVDFFLSLLEPKFSALEELGVYPHQITLACFYEHERHSAIDLSPAQLKRLGDSGIALSIDSWPSGIGQAVEGSRAN